MRHFNANKMRQVGWKFPVTLQYRDFNPKIAKKISLK
jgi:hypothetical protein